MATTRRDFLKVSTLAASAGILWPLSRAMAKKVRILIWDERADTEKDAYDHFLGNYIAGQLQKDPAFTVVSAGLDDPGQGISDNMLDKTDVLMWWGHVRQQEILPEKGKSIVERIRAGSLSLIALHSAHWSTPFVQAMNEITRLRTLKAAKEQGITESYIHFIDPPQQFTVPKYDTRLTPYTIERRYPDGHTEWEVHRPFCCFPAYRNDGKPSTVRVLEPGHPVMRGIPSGFRIEQTEMYDEPFHVPDPDQVIFEESWEKGEWFRSAMIWNLGKGRIFYFRPGHEQFPVYKDPRILQILSNAAKWLAS